MKSILATLVFLTMPVASFAAVSSTSQMCSRACGTEQSSVSDRIANCQKARDLDNSQPACYLQRSETGAVWILVTRSIDPVTGKHYEVWQDGKTGNLWGDKVDGPHTFKVTAPSDYSPELSASKACGSPAGQKANGGITDRKFKLPTLAEFETASKNGLRSIFHDDSSFHRYWTSSLEDVSGYPTEYASVYIYDSVLDTSEQYPQVGAFALVRCIAR